MSAPVHVRGVARLIFRQIECPYLDGTEFSAADARAVNRDGWTFETSAPLGNVVRHDGVILTASELDQAWQLAQSWLVAS